MGSRHFNGVRFQSYSLDHLPPHVHGSSNGVTLLLELLANGTVEISERAGAVTPGNAPDNEVRRIRRIAVKRYAELLALWEATHGKTF